MRTLNHVGLEPYISRARLNTYSTFFNPADQVELIGCYLWSKEVSTAFFPVLQALEVALRNSIHNEASIALGSYWFDNIATRPRHRLSTSQQRNIKHLTSSIRNTRDEIRRDLSLPSHAPISADRIVAKMTFGFWTNLFSAAFDVNRNPMSLWPRLLRPIFPNAPRGHRRRATIQKKLLTIKTFRNKAFHHEPIWNIGRPLSVQDSITKLLDTKDLIMEVIEWISLDSLELVEKAGYASVICRVCSVEHLEYLKNPGYNDRSLSRVKRELRSILKKANNTTDITLNGSLAGKVIGG